MTFCDYLHQSDHPLLDTGTTRLGSWLGDKLRGLLLLIDEIDKLVSLTEWMQLKQDDHGGGCVHALIELNCMSFMLLKMRHEVDFKVQLSKIHHTLALTFLFGQNKKGTFVSLHQTVNFSKDPLLHDVDSLKHRFQLVAWRMMLIALMSQSAGMASAELGYNIFL
ncbi:hypothetical protein Tco_0628544 [Tanacetum coccineum]|uniref:Uncharacterized protein n=1 Tax=Tanacetum coccineum TaxID=301880 RepID=A0ABQ4WQP4_9ASTR